MSMPSVGYPVTEHQKFESTKFNQKENKMTFLSGKLDDFNSQGEKKHALPAARGTKGTMVSSGCARCKGRSRHSSANSKYTHNGRENHNMDCETTNRNRSMPPRL